MGIGIFKRSSAGNYSPPNPNPNHYELKARARVGKASVVMLKYKGCTTYKGLKILVYKNYKEWKSIHARGHVDPHFIETKTSPIARFPATSEGWDLAVAFAKLLEEK